jgi:hypothetical protein
MDQSKNQILFSLFIFTLVVGFIAGFVIGGVYGAIYLAQGNPENAYAQVWDAAKAKLKQAGYIPQETKALGGKIVDMKGNQIILETELLHPIQDESLKYRKVSIGEKTDVVLRRMKSNTEIMAMEESRNLKMIELYQRYEATSDDEEKGKIQTEINDLYSDHYHTESKINLSDLRTGDFVVVESAGDITDVPVFDASKIIKENQAMDSEQGLPQVPQEPETEAGNDQ